MKDIQRFSAPNGTIQVAQRFQVANIVVMNSTAYTIGIRFGAQDVPRDISECDFWVPPAMMMAFTVVGREFALAYMLPQLALQPEGMPIESLVMFLDYGEPVPTFGTIALSSVDTRIVNDHLDVNILNAEFEIASGTPVRVDIARATINTPVVNAPNTALAATEANDVLLYTEKASSGHTYPYTLAEPRRIFPFEYLHGIRSVVIAGISPEISNLTITGRESGHVYMNIDPRLYSQQNSFVMPFYRGADETLSIAYTQEADETASMFYVTGHQSMVQQQQTVEGLSHSRILPADILIDSFKVGPSIPAGTAAMTLYGSYLPSDLYRTTVRGLEIQWLNGLGTPAIDVRISDVSTVLPIFRILLWGTGTGYYHDSTLDIPLRGLVPTRLDVFGANTGAAAAQMDVTVLLGLERV
jgi:hypothetical protein